MKMNELKEKALTIVKERKVVVLSVSAVLLLTAVAIPVALTQGKPTQTTKTALTLTTTTTTVKVKAEDKNKEKEKAVKDKIETALKQDVKADTDLSSLEKEIETITDTSVKQAYQEKLSQLKQTVEEKKKEVVAKKEKEATVSVTSPQDNTANQSVHVAQNVPTSSSKPEQPQPQEQPKPSTPAPQPKVEQPKVEQPKPSPANEPLKIHGQVWVPRSSYEKVFMTEDEAIAYFLSLENIDDVDNYRAVGYGSYPSNRGVVWMVYCYN
ncbi:hypothetical protein KG091_00665 [Carnobacteriaceae bacterium zg-ZUI78]|nr:hypothetical protein [Carnobacteriaceae bacterium zg-ZUI78]